MNIFSTSPLGKAFKAAALASMPIAAGGLGYMIVAGSFSALPMLALVVGATAWTAGLTAHDYEMGVLTPKYIEKGEQAPVLKR